MINQQYEKLKVLSYSHTNKQRLKMWNCQCECGNLTTVAGNSLRTGHTKSCGCLSRITASQIAFKDLTGQRFNRLLVMYPVGKALSGAIVWHCVCDCDDECNVRSDSLRNQHTQSCGCLNKEINSTRTVRNLVGQQFGKLTVLWRKDNDQWQNAMWECYCECGNSVIVKGGSLIQGFAQSCGCLNTQMQSEWVASHIKHNCSACGEPTEERHRAMVMHKQCYVLYKKLCSMRQRCYNPKNKGYFNYGGRGITICNEWLHSFPDFFKWAIENGFELGKEIHRINNDGNYEPSNCELLTEPEHIAKHAKRPRRS